MIKGTLNPATFAALADADKMKAYVGGSAAALPSDFEGESIEESVKFALEHAGLNGSEFLRSLFARMPIAKLGIKIVSMGVTNVLVDALMNHSGINPAAKEWIRLIGRNVLQGIIAGYVDMSDSEKGRRALDQAIHDTNTSQYVNKVEAVVPGKAMVVLMTDPATSIKMIHAAATDGAAYADIPDSGSPAVPATACMHCEQAYALHTATFRKETTTTGSGKGGTGGGTKVTAAPAYRNAKRMPLSDAAVLSGVFWCPQDWPAGKPAAPKPALPVVPWHTQVGPEGVALFDALNAFAFSTDTKVDDVVAKSLAGFATRMNPEEWKDLAAQVKSDAGVYAKCWQMPAAKTAHSKAKDEGLTTKGFNTVIGRINGRVPEANIPPLAQAEIAAHNVLDKAKHILHGILHNEVDEDGHEKPWSFKAKLALVVSLLTAISLPLGYIAWALVSVVIFCAGAFGWWADQAWNNYLILAGSIGAILWLLCWYFGAAFERVFGGIFHTHVDEHGNTGLTDTARNITALFFGSGTVAMLICDAGMILDISTYAIRAITIPVVIASIIAYDRYAATGHGSEAVHHLVEHLKVNTIGRLAAIASFAAVIGIGPLSYLEYQKNATTFQLVVEQSGGTFYVPTPKGGAFSDEVLGRITATAIEAEMTHQSGPVRTYSPSKVVCLPAGSKRDLPGYVLMKQDPVDASCAEGTASWLMRPSVFWFARENGPKEYGSLAEMPAAEAKANAEADTQAAEAQAKADADAKAKADAEALAKAQANAAANVVQPTYGRADTSPVRAVVSDADRCARLAGFSPDLRASQGCP